MLNIIEKLLLAAELPAGPFPPIEAYVDVPITETLRQEFPGGYECFVKFLLCIHSLTADDPDRFADKFKEFVSFKFLDENADETMQEPVAYGSLYSNLLELVTNQLAYHHQVSSSMNNQRGQRQRDLDILKRGAAAARSVGLNALHTQAEDTRKGLYDKVADFFDPLFLYARACKQLNQENDEGKDVLHSIFNMKTKNKVDTLRVLRQCLFEFVQSTGYNDEQLEHAVKNYQEPDDETKKALGSPALESSVYKNLNQENNSLKNPVVKVISSPDGSTGGLIVLPDIAKSPVAQRTNGSTIALRVHSERAMHATMVDLIQQYDIGKDAIKAVEIRGLYIPTHDQDMPDGHWSRATVRVVIDKESTAISPQINGVKCYTLRSIGNKDEKPDPIIDHALQTIPVSAYSAEQAATWMVLNQNYEGKALIKTYQAKIEANGYKPIDMAQYHNYFNYAAYLRDGDPNRPYVDVFKDRATYNSMEVPFNQFKNHAVVIKKFEDLEFKPKLRKLFATNYAIRGAIAEELSVGCSVQIVAACMMFEKIGIKKVTAVAVHSHVVLEKMGVKVEYTDGFLGQNMMGESVPIGRRVNRDYDVINVGHSYPEVDLLDNRLDKYERKSDMFLDIGDYGPADRPVLVDFTIPGGLYNPQRDENFDANEFFHGQKMLVGTYSYNTCYTLKQLLKFDAFVVYVGQQFFTAEGIDDKIVYRRELARLFLNYACTLTPTPITDLWGAYLVGVRRDRAGKYANWPTPAESLTFLRGSLVTLNSLKVAAVTAGFTGYATDMGKIYKNNVNVYNAFPRCLKHMRKHRGLPIGTKQAVMDYVTTTKQKIRQEVDMQKLANVPRYFSQDETFKDVRDVMQTNDADSALFAQMLQEYENEIASE